MSRTRVFPRMQRLAKQWVKIAKKLEKIADKKQALGEILMQTMKNRRQFRLECGKSVVYFVSVWAKRPTKTDVGKYFGKKKAEKFWARLPAIPSEYLSLTQTS